MKRFLLKISLFLLPVILLIIPPVFILIKSKESFNDIDKILISNEKYLIGYLYNEKNYRYLKWNKLVLNKKYDVLALGSSRILEFREKMFNNARFYNAGYTVPYIEDFVPFLKSIPKNKYPKYLIIGLDQFSFNENYKIIEQSKKKEFWSNSFQKNPNLKTLINTWKGIFNKEYNFDFKTKKNDIQLVGLNACIQGVGFRNDGSMDYGVQIDKLLKEDKSARDYNFETTFDRIRRGDSRFLFGNNLNKKAIVELKKLLSFCKENNIELIAFIPPFADKVNVKLKESNKYNYMNHIFKTCLPLFKKNNFELYDFSSPSTIQSNDSEFIDGFHSGEVNYLRMLIKMLENNSKLNNVTNVDILKSDLEKRKNRLDVYGY